MYLFVRVRLRVHAILVEFLLKLFEIGAVQYFLVDLFTIRTGFRRQLATKPIFLISS